jgi:thiamine-monophosphate kinase
MMDVSDGLASDIRHICAASRIGCELSLTQIAQALSPELRAYAQSQRRDPLAFALTGGEDYVLLVAADPRLPSALAGSGIELIEIGQMVEEPLLSVLEEDGTRRPLASLGWDHFRAPSP